MHCQPLKKLALPASTKEKILLISKAEISKKVLQKVDCSVMCPLTYYKEVTSPW